MQQSDDSLEWRGAFESGEMNVLHAQAFGHALLADDWWGQVNRHSLGWVCLRHAEKLTGFVNVAWDGGVHAFVLDTIVAADCRREGIGRALVAAAVVETRRAGCEWLHVDFDEHLRQFYFEGCGFVPTDAGLIDLSPHASVPLGSRRELA